MTTVLSERRGGVLVLTLNRPERLNAWTEEMEERYFHLLDEAEASQDVRAVVVTGAGRGFCAGADMDNLHDVDDSDIAALVRRDPPRHRPLLFGKPLIAAVNGAAAGLGLVEALYCDVRFAAPEAKLTAAFSRRGLIAEYGVAWLLPRLVGRSRALDILLSSRLVLGEEALQMGLVDRVVGPEELLDAAVAYADDMATHCSPTSMQAIKQQVLNAQNAAFTAAAEEADQRMVEAFTGPDFVEGVTSYVQGRPPRFPGLAAR
jgi:enoyl-CoA hydratase/carnithine racemase